MVMYVFFDYELLYENDNKFTEGGQPSDIDFLYIKVISNVILLSKLFSNSFR